MRGRKNGRYARPTSDRSFAGAIAEAHSFFIVAEQVEGIGSEYRRVEVEVVGRGDGEEH